MSNPAVTKLKRKKIGRYEVWLDDNIGERMHLHINRFRVDLDYPEMEKLCKEDPETEEIVKDIKTNINARYG